MKVDRLFEWKRGPNSGIVDTIKKQKKNTKQEFDERVQIVIKEFSEQVCDFRGHYRASVPLANRVKPLDYRVLGKSHTK